MKTNLSDKTCVFSDFPWSPKPAGNFPTAIEMLNYLRQYSEHFKVNPTIRFNAKVISVQKTDQNKWEVFWKHNEVVNSESFDNLIVSTGIFNTAYSPKIKGVSYFKDKISHAQQYMGPLQFTGKKVVIIGNAFTGTEIANDLILNGVSTTIIARRPYVVVPRRIGDEDIDQAFFVRASSYTEDLISNHEKSNTKINIWLRKLSKQEDLPKHLQVKDSLESPPRIVISDNFEETIKKVKFLFASIQKFLSEGILLTNGSFIPADEVVLATGYRCFLPFFDDEILKKLEYVPEDPLQPLILYKETLPKNIPNLAFVGMYRGSYFPTIELQARWVNSLFAKKVDYPTVEAMDKELEIERAIRTAYPRAQFPHENYVQFTDSIAAEIGALPNFKRLKWANPFLHYLLWEKPLHPIHYRLNDLYSHPEGVTNLFSRDFFDN